MSLSKRFNKAQPSTSEGSFRLSALDVGRSMFEVFCSYENRTSFPGSISKSSTIESSVFGLITSSVNFT